MKNIVLKDVEVDVQAPGFDVEGCIPCSKLEYDIVGKIYVVLKYSDDPQMCMTTVACKLIFKVLELAQDGDEGEAYEDEYPVRSFRWVSYLKICFPIITAGEPRHQHI